ncbi:MAG TPA: homoaconitate hydratase [Thermoplasmata archaeon]|nr:homoaconitate hydratase [Thermoplasmata archaeon]
MAAAQDSMGDEAGGGQLVHNYIVEQGFARRLPKRITFWDETMRDGEQTPGVYFSPEEKLQIATALSEIGVDIMDVGIPVVSKEEARGVRLIANAGLNASIMSAARAVRGDVEACIDCDVDEISIFIACSDLHLKYKLNMTREQVLEAAVREVEYARGHGLKVTFVTEDTFRADLDYVTKLYNACIDAGAERIVLSDTIGIMTPSAIQWYLGEVKSRFKPAQLSVHLHDDFGLATSNNLAALEVGVEVPHTCVNGIGERAGNAPFEELVMALEAVYGYKTGIDVSRLYEVSRLVEKLSGIPIPVNKAVVGYNAFSHESGIHADGVIKHTGTYEPMQPERIGRERRFIFGKHTGSMAVLDKLKRHGLEPTKEQLQEIVNGIKSAAESRRKEEQIAFIEMYREREEKRRGVTDPEFWEIVRSAGLTPP